MRKQGVVGCGSAERQTVALSLRSGDGRQILPPTQHTPPLASCAHRYSCNIGVLLLNKVLLSSAGLK